MRYKFMWHKLKIQWEKDWLLCFLCLVIALLVFCLLFVGFDTTIGAILSWFLGTCCKKETIEYIAFGIGGALTAIGVSAIQRLALTQIQQNQLTEKGHIDDRFKSAIDHLASDHISARISAFYQFYHLAKDQQNDNFRKSIFEILCSCLRSMPRNKSHLSKENGSFPTEECQTLLNILFKSDDKSVFAEFNADIQRSYLVYTDLTYANLSNATLKSANLSGANFLGANLSKALFLHANISDANLVKTNLSNAMLVLANLSGANLLDANLLGANLLDANLSGADLSGADFQRTQLKGVNLFTTYRIEKADFRGAKIGDRPITKDDIPVDKGEYYADWNPPPKEDTV